MPIRNQSVEPCEACWSLLLLLIVWSCSCCCCSCCCCCCCCWYCHLSTCHLSDMSDSISVHESCHNKLLIICSLIYALYSIVIVMHSLFLSLSLPFSLLHLYLPQCEVDRLVYFTICCFGFTDRLWPNNNNSIIIIISNSSSTIVVSIMPIVQCNQLKGK